MTDYLEQLLDERQEEDEKEPFAWKRRRTGNRSLSGEDGAERQMVRQERVGAEHAAGRDEGLWEETVSVKSRMADPAGRLAALERAVSRGKRLQVAREQGRERVEAAQAMRGQAMHGRSAVTGVQRGLAGLLDAAFERDARRYDGPLSLF